MIVMSLVVVMLIVIIAKSEFDSGYHDHHDQHYDHGDSNQHCKNGDDDQHHHHCYVREVMFEFDSGRPSFVCFKPIVEPLNVTSNIVIIIMSMI